MACACKKKHQQAVYEGASETSPRIFYITPTTDTAKKTILSQGEQFIIDRGGVRVVVNVHLYRTLRVAEIEQLLAQGAPIHVYG